MSHIMFLQSEPNERRWNIMTNFCSLKMSKAAQHYALCIMQLWHERTEDLWPDIQIFSQATGWLDLSSLRPIQSYVIFCKPDFNGIMGKLGTAWVPPVSQSSMRGKKSSAVISFYENLVFVCVWLFGRVAPIFRNSVSDWFSIPVYFFKAWLLPRLSLNCAQLQVLQHCLSSYSTCIRCHSSCEAEFFHCFPR